MTPLQAKFVDEYLIDLNATQAAIRAGYAESGARTEGARLLANADIADAIAVAKAERSAKTAIDAAWVLIEAQSVYAEARKIGKLPEALKALELCGKHVDIQAFKDKIEHSGALSLVVSSEDAGL